MSDNIHRKTVLNPGEKLYIIYWAVFHLRLLLLTLPRSCPPGSDNPDHR